MEGGAGPWSALRLSRSPKEKPFIDAPDKHVALNVSHHGDAVVGVASCATTIGVDVMRVDAPRGLTQLWLCHQCSELSLDRDSRP